MEELEEECDVADGEYDRVIEQEREITDMVDAITAVQENLISQPRDTESDTEVTEQQKLLPSTSAIGSITKDSSDKVSECPQNLWRWTMLFSSVAVACGFVLLPCNRNEGGWPMDADLPVERQKWLMS